MQNSQTFPSQTLTFANNNILQGTDLQLTLNTDLPSGFTIKILEGASGKPVMQKKVSDLVARSSVIHISTVNLPKGEYILRINPDSRPLYTFTVY